MEFSEWNLCKNHIYSVIITFSSLLFNISLINLKARYPVHNVQPKYKKRCFSPKFSDKIEGKNIKKPSSIIIRLNIAIVLTFNLLSIFLQNIRASIGESIISGKGIPIIPCNLKGIGKIAGPARNEKKNINSSGMVLILLELQIL